MKVSDEGEMLVACVMYESRGRKPFGNMWSSAGQQATVVAGLPQPVSGQVQAHKLWRSNNAIE